AKAAATRKADAVKAATEAKLALEPASVYISRATSRLYVRRNTHKPAPDGGGEVFDATIEVPVTIRNPDRPTGTHVFTAMASSDDWGNNGFVFFQPNPAPQPGNTRPRAGQYYQPMQRRWW